MRKSKSARSGQIEDPEAAGLARARKAWREYRANADDDRDAVYIYLEVVFVVVQQWEKMSVADDYSLKALKLQEFRIRMKPDPYARLIYCTSDADAKTRSKWAKIMQWVAIHNKESEPFADFVKRHGGLNECATLASLDRPPRKKRSRHR
jgi:alkanesulfonate monooxygenase SsuD/methylene tetrahydromethanopterin reductase-like flavin-dependent oxidoreductase (luciferase family)